MVTNFKNHVVGLQRQDNYTPTNSSRSINSLYTFHEYQCTLK